MGRMIRLGAVALIMLVLPILAPASGMRAAQGADCDDIDAYVLALRDVGTQMETALAGFDDDDSLDEWDTADYTAAAEAIRQVKELLIQIDLPPVAETFHSLLLEQFDMLAQMFDTMATTGIFGALMYAEQMETLGEQVESAAMEIETACGVDLTSELGIADSGDTTPAGSDESTPPVNTTTLGTRANPIPMGETVQLDDEWEVTVLSVEPDATDSILAADSFAEPPAAGHQFFVATVRVTYIGETSEEFYGWNLRTVGQSAVSYDQFDNSCGWSVPNELPSNELFTGGTIEGNLCWSIDSADADSLVLYDGDQRGSDRIFLSLMPSSSTASPVPAVATPGTPATPDAAGDQKSA